MDGSGQGGVPRWDTKKIVFNQGWKKSGKTSLRFRRPGRTPCRHKTAQRSARLAKDGQQRPSPRRAVLHDQVAAVAFMRVFRAAGGIVPCHRLQHPKINWIDHFSFVP
jgi:hypothetical protein